MKKVNSIEIILSSIVLTMIILEVKWRRLWKIEEELNNNDAHDDNDKGGDKIEDENNVNKYDEINYDNIDKRDDKKVDENGVNKGDGNTHDDNDNNDYEKKMIMMWIRW